MSSEGERTPRLPYCEAGSGETIVWIADGEPLPKHADALLTERRRVIVFAMAADAGMPQEAARRIGPRRRSWASRGSPDGQGGRRLGRRARTLRRALGLTQEEFAARYHIPIGTLRDWEQGRSEPDQPARAYLNVIAPDPDGVRRALETGPKPTPR